MVISVPGIVQLARGRSGANASAPGTCSSGGSSMRASTSQSRTAARPPRSRKSVGGMALRSSVRTARARTRNTSSARSRLGASRYAMNACSNSGIVSTKLCSVARGLEVSGGASSDCLARSRARRPPSASAGARAGEIVGEPSSCGLVGMAATSSVPPA